MIDLFEKLAPRWQNAVKAFTLDVWQNDVTDYSIEQFNNKALRFSKAYRRALEEHYAARGMRVYRGTLDGKVNDWLITQYALRDTLPVAIRERQQNLVTREIDKLRGNESATAQKMLNKLYGAKENETVYKVFSFADSFKDRAEQIGDENAYDLGTKMNEEIIGQYSDRYIWRTQRDRRVRDTHRLLEGKCFLFNDPPTEVFKNGKRHAGNPGSAWGCVPSGTRIRLNSDVVRCFRRKYAGELTLIVTESGISVRATGNHPILTHAGWKPADLVEVGDYVVKVPDKSADAAASNIYDVGVPVEKIFNFFTLCGDEESVPGARSQFHGDGIPEEKVDIISANWELTNERNPGSGEQIRKLIFTDPDVMADHLLGASESEFYAARFWLGLSSLGGMRGSCDFHSLFGSGILEADDVGLTTVSRSYTAIDNQALDESASSWASEIMTSASDSAHSFDITFDDLIFERVVAVDREVFNGHVYNLQTATNWYIANGLSIHNCRCFAEPADKKAKPKRRFFVYEH